ncbi:hypothetical protein MANES_S095209v8 [Manihot esculenta]|uniref:Uncharacterized protein n=1 Tax=Manihot esculenta TaxID=3983 RepID=A0ACB7FVR0_MANES|nr:hypothetical protein MANES_S095209v8 [Manihot esculenta]
MVFKGGLFLVSLEIAPAGALEIAPAGALAKCTSRCNFQQICK